MFAVAMFFNQMQKEKVQKMETSVTKKNVHSLSESH